MDHWAVLEQAARPHVQVDSREVLFRRTTTTEGNQMEIQAMTATTLKRLADQLSRAGNSVWDQPSLCEGWRVREVVAHMTMAVRLTPAEFIDQLQAAGGGFHALSNAIATRDANLPIQDHLANLESDQLARWEPPAGGAMGALNHAVVHALDITIPVGLDRSCSDDSAVAILDWLTREGNARAFGTDLTDMSLTANDLDWSWGQGSRHLTAPAGQLIAQACGRVVI